MIIAIPFAGKDLSVDVAAVMIASCRNTMPGTPIWQLSDETTPQLPDTDKVVRKPMTSWARFYFDHMLDLPPETIRLDYDVIVQKDVRNVFSMDFDVAFTRRPLNDPTCSNSIRLRNPHNHGVMFIRNGKPFFTLSRGIYEQQGKNWMDVAMSMEAAAADPNIFWIELPGERYNFTPKRRADDVSHCSIVHYKGDRKKWMVDSETAKSDGARVLGFMEMLK